MSALLDDITAEQGKPILRCSVAVVHDRLLERDPEMAADFKTAVAGKETYTAKAIVKALAKREIALGSTTIQRHRRGECQCPTS